MMQEPYHSDDEAPRVCAKDGPLPDYPVLAQKTQQYLEDCQFHCAVGVVYAATAQTPGMAVDDAWRLFQTFPLSALDWLYTPEGWARLIQELRIGLGFNHGAPRVTIN